MTLVPAGALIFSPFIANRINPRILGLPFLLAWVVIWVLITAIVMAVMLRLDGDP